MNRLHDRYGTLWAKRFKSLVVEDGQGLQGPELKLAKDGRRGDLVLHLEAVEGLRAGDAVMIEGAATDRWKKLTGNACRWKLA